MALRTEILRAEVGSTLHGVGISGYDDRDEMGVCIEDPNFVIGLGRFEQYIFRTQPPGKRSGHGDVDLVVYSLRKWMRLALGGNPTVLLLLFVPPEKLVKQTEAGRRLQALAPKIASKKAAPVFLGYLEAQRQRLTGERGQKDVSRPGSTWIANAAVFFAILLMVLVANVVVRRWRPPLAPAYAVLVIALLVYYVFPMERLLYASWTMKLLGVTLLAGVPVFCAGIAFSTLFGSEKDPQYAFGSNLLGALAGGLLEYLSMVTGFRALVLLAAALYLVPILLTRRRIAPTATA